MDVFVTVIISLISSSSSFSSFVCFPLFIIQLLCVAVVPAQKREEKRREVSGVRYQVSSDEYI